MPLDAASYYSDLTRQYQRYSGEARGWHFGIWESDVRNHRGSLLRSNEYLVRGLSIDSSTRILDIGFGEGGFSSSVSRASGAQVTGISLCEDHATLAGRLAHARGTGGSCRFLTMNMNGLAFSAGSFDLAVNQETFCYASPKEAYLNSIHRVLSPGGTWRALAFAVQEGTLSEKQQSRLTSVLEGFHIPSLKSPARVESMLKSTGFVDVQVEDITPLVLRTATLIKRQCCLPRLMMKCHLDWTFFSINQKKRLNRKGHINAAYAYCRGLLEGYLKYAFYSARKPG